MQKRYFISFSLRLAAVEPLSAVHVRVQEALGCTLQRGEYAGVPAFVGDLLGIRVGLFLWRGFEGAHVYQLHGLPDWKALRDLEIDEIRIDDAVVDLLQSRGAGAWRKPFPGEGLAESNYDVDDI